MHALGNAQSARNMQLLATVAESLHTTVNGIPPERFLEFRMRVDGNHNVKVLRIVAANLRVNTNRMWIEVEFIYSEVDDSTNETAARNYDIWVVGDNELTGSF